MGEDNTQLMNVFHGTSEVFVKFDSNNIKNVMANDTDDVVYATDSEEEARIAGNPSILKSIVIKLRGKMNNPFVVDANGTEKHKSFGNIGYKKVIDMAKNNNHDGIIIKNVIDFGNIPQTTFIFLNPKTLEITGIIR